ncbi:MAG: PSD1 and planctomycete cytochrome C domain-containing protein [Bryobacteraceae bacterium]
MLLALLLAAVDFSTQVHPILAARCSSCHNPRMQQGGLSLEKHADVRRVVTPGNSASSLLIQRVTGAKAPRMPMGGQPMPESEIAILRAWIDAGAPAPTKVEVSSWVPKLELTAPALPDSPEPHPVDKILSAYFRRNGISAPPAAGGAQFLRRAYLDLHGLLPPPETFGKPVDRAALIDSLLADNQKYTHHWITFWNDLLRNDEGVVYHGDRKSITPWLRPALERNLPYDRFVQTLLNPSAKADPEGFLIGVNWRGDINASQTPVMQAAQNTAQIFLGINLKCNSCHDSFINQWKLKDAYGLASFFSETPLQLHRCDVPTGITAEAKFLYPKLGGVATDAPLAEKRAAAARLFTMKENGRMPRTLVNRIWKTLMGRGIVEPVDDMDAEPWSPELLDWLAADFVDHGYDIKHLLRRIMTSRAYASQSVKEAPAIPYVFRGPHARRLSAEQFLEGVSSVTGEWRLLVPAKPEPATYARDWQIKSTPLGRSMGRPIRDQVTTERLTQPTTLQALELVNGSTLSTLLRRGAQRLTGSLPPSPEPLFDSGSIRAETVAADIDVRGASKLWLVLADIDSYDPSLTRAGWMDARFDDAPVAGLPGTEQAPIKPKDKEPKTAIIAAVPSTRVLDVPKGAIRFRTTVSVDELSLASDINPRVRFFIYKEQPDPGRYYAVRGETPVPAPPKAANLRDLVRRLYRHALGREPNAAERRVTAEFGFTADGVEDLLWSLCLSPEFQYIL